MKFYYGNSIKEAMMGNPVEIETVAQLKQYQSQYTFVIEADLGEDLPTTVTVNINDLNYDPEEGGVLSDVLSDFLSDEYGFCHNGFDYDTDSITGDITITDIEWDIDEYDEEEFEEEEED